MPPGWRTYWKTPPKCKIKMSKLRVATSKPGGKFPSHSGTALLPRTESTMMARGQGLTGIGPVEDAAELERVLVDAIAAVKKGETVVVDVIVQTGYSPAMTAGMTRSQD